MTTRKRKKRADDGLRLTDKHHPVFGVISTILAVVSLVIFVVICLVVGQSHTTADFALAVAGLMCFVISICGFLIAWLSLREENIRPLFPTIGAVGNGLLLVAYLLLYVWGTIL